MLAPWGKTWRETGGSGCLTRLEGSLSCEDSTVDPKEDSDAGRDWGQEEKGTTEDERLDGVTDSMDMSLGELWVSDSV